MIIIKEKKKYLIKNDINKHYIYNLSRLHSTNVKRSNRKLFLP